MSCFLDGGSANPVANSQLAAAIDRAKQDGVTVATIQNALKKSDEKDDAKPFTFEVRGVSGTFFIIEVITNNVRRTKQTLQPALNKCK
jgi:transcriptional/translational regulatory protein YebC/TACO1